DLPFRSRRAARLARAPSEQTLFRPLPRLLHRLDRPGWSVEPQPAVPAVAERTGPDRERDREQEGREHELREPEERCDADRDERHASDESREEGLRAHAEHEEREG